MQFRPPGAPRILATDVAYNAPGKSWDTLDTKIEPSAAEIAAGFTPEEPIEAEVHNFLGNDSGKRLLAVDLIDVSNWPEPAPGAGTVASAGNSHGGMVESPNVAAGSIPAAGRLYTFVTNDEKIQRSDDGGYSWAAEYTSAGNDFIGIAAGAASVAAILDVAGVPKLAKVSTSQAWTEQSIATAGAGSIASIAWDPVAAKYIMGGEKSGLLDGGIYTATEADLPQTMIDISPATSNGDPIDMIAVGTDVVLLSDGTSVYTWTRTGVASKTWDVPGGYSVRSLVADTSTGYFYAACTNGTNNGRVYESADGTTWTLKSAGTPIDDFDFTGLTMHVRGSALLFAGELNGVKRLALSSDRGVSWTFLPDPIGRHGAFQTGVLCLVGNRLAALAYKSAGDRIHAFAMRAGPLV